MASVKLLIREIRLQAEHLSVGRAHGSPFLELLRMAGMQHCAGFPRGDAASRAMVFMLLYWFDQIVESITPQHSMMRGAGSGETWYCLLNNGMRNEDPN